MLTANGKKSGCARIDSMTTRRTKPPGAYVGKEDAFQRTAIARVRQIGKEHGIDSRAIMHIPNGGLRNDRVAANLKAQGTVAGYPDIMVFKPKAVQVHVPIMKARAFTLDDLARGKETVTESRVCCGLAMELKVWPNKPTDEQFAIHELLRTAGWRVVVCYSIDQVEEEAMRYFDAG